MGKSLMNKKNMSKKRITGIILIVTLVFLVGYAFVQYTAEPDLRKKDGKENRMPFDGTFFQITKEELIQNLNDDIKKEGIPEISTTYALDGWNINKPTEIADDIKTYECMKYEYKISDTLKLYLYEFPELGDGIAAIILTCEGNPGIGKAENAEGDAYYKIICNNLAPDFDVDRFDTHARHNTHYKLDQLDFFCSFTQRVSEDGSTTDLREYGVHAVNLGKEYLDCLW